MLNTNIKFILRRLRKQPVFTSINGIGLTLGLIVFLFILQYVKFQWSYNSMYPQADRTYRLLHAIEGEDLDSGTAPGFAPRIKENVPGVELASRHMMGIGSGTVLVEQENTGTVKTFKELGLAFVDNDFLAIFPLKVLKGKPELIAPNRLVLTESAALQYFQTTDVVNEQLVLINQFGEHSFQITGVIENFPNNSDIQANILASMSTFESKEYIGYNTWLDMNALNSNFVRSFFTLSNPEVKENVIAYCQTLVKVSGNSSAIKMDLQSVSDMHLNSGAGAIYPTFGNAKLVWFLLILAILILSIAWINYINLSTAQSLKKAHAVSVKKVIGASRGYLIRQQLAETFLLTTASAMLAVMGCFLLQPFFNYLVDYPLHLSMLLDWSFLSASLFFLIITSLIAGFYVAFVLTGFDPSLVLKGSFLRSGKGIFIRKALVTTQFAITIAFIAGMVIMLMQIDYLQNKDTGITTENLLAFTGPSNYSEGWMESKDAFLEQVKQLSFVKKYTATGGNPGQNTNMSISLSRDREQVDMNENLCDVMFIDESFLDVFEIEILGGQAPSAVMVKTGWWGNKKLILSETAAKKIGFENPLDAVNKPVYFQYNGEVQEREVLAVIEDYHQGSLHSEMMPMVLAPSANHVWFTLQLAGETSSQQLAEVESVYKQHFPKSPFIYQFVEEYHQAFYEQDRRLGQLISVGTFIAIFISCLGLFGLVAYTVEQRTKEIGIRKVLGASASHIVGLISKDFIPLVIIAIVIAAPIAYFFMNQWLEDFAYRIDIQWWVFALAGAVAISIALVTVSFQSIKAALANPVKSLRNE